MKDRLKKKLNRLKVKPASKADVFPTLAAAKLSEATNNEQFNTALDSAMENLEDLFIIIKNDTPHLFEEFKELTIQDMSNEDVEEFYRRIALKEAYRAGKISEPPPAYKTPKPKVYEMPVEYRQNLEKLTEMIESRDEHTRLLPTLPPEAKIKATSVLNDLSRAIENTEEILAAEYERYQEEKADEEFHLSVIKVKHWRRTAKRYLFIKKYQSHALEAFKETLMEDEEWVDIARWIDRLESEGYNPPPAGSA